MEIPGDIYIKHDFVDKSIETSEVSGLVLATAVVLTLFSYFLLAFFSWCLRGCFLLIFIPSCEGLHRLANYLPNFYKFTKACKNSPSHVSVVARVVRLAARLVSQKFWIWVWDCKLEIVAKFFIVAAFVVQVVEFRFPHRAYLLTKYFSVVEFREMMIYIRAEFVVGFGQFFEELVHQEGNVINHVVANKRLFWVCNELHHEAESHFLDPKMFHLRSFNGRQALWGIIFIFLVEEAQSWTLMSQIKGLENLRDFIFDLFIVYLHGSWVVTVFFLVDHWILSTEAEVCNYHFAFCLVVWSSEAS